MTEQSSALVIYGHASVESFMDFDGEFRVAPSAGRGEQLDLVRPQGDGVIVGDDAAVREAEDGVGIQGGGPGSICRGRIGRGVQAARVRAGQKTREEAGRVVPIPHMSETQFSAKAILEGGKEAFDPAFRLRGRGWDPADAELMQGASDLRGVRAAAQLLGQGERGERLGEDKITERTQRSSEPIDRPLAMC